MPRAGLIQAASGERAGAAHGIPAPARAWRLALGVSAFALAIRLAAAVRLPNVLWPDEIFQSLEQAHRLVFGSGVVPWEFREGTRSWLLPGLLAAPMALARGWASPALLAQGLLCLLALAPVAVAFATAARARGALAGLVAGLAAAVWFELVFFAPKALNEVVAAHLLLLGLHLEATGTRTRRRAAAGALLGLAATLRMHLAPAIVLALACSRDWSVRRWRALAAGAVAPVALAGLLDLLTWGRPFHSFLASFRYNVVEGKSALYGTAPWSAYLAALGSTWSWAAALVLPLAALGARRRPTLAACALGALATHMSFAHKEYRFVYPVILLVVALAAIGMGELLALLSARAPRVRAAWIAAALLLCWTGASVARALPYRTTRLDPLDPAPVSRWTHQAWGPEAMALAGTRPDLCGVGLVLTSWIWTGGYTYLERPVPMFLIVNERDGIESAGGYNSVIAPAVAVPNLTGFTVRRCWPGGMCLAERPGGCRPVRARTINDRLVEWGS